MLEEKLGHKQSFDHLDPEKEETSTRHASHNDADSQNEEKIALQPTLTQSSN